MPKEIAKDWKEKIEKLLEDKRRAEALEAAIKQLHEENRKIMGSFSNKNDTWSGTSSSFPKNTWIGAPSSFPNYPSKVEHIYTPMQQPPTINPPTINPQDINNWQNLIYQTKKTTSTGWNWLMDNYLKRRFMPIEDGVHFPCE